MSREDVEHYIRSQNGSTLSIADQIIIAHWLRDRGIGPAHDGLKRTEIAEAIGDRLDYQVRTSLKHLREADIVEEFRDSGPDTYVIADWHEEVFVMGMVDEAAAEGVEALIDHIQDDDPSSSGDAPAVADGGVTLRRVVSSQFDLQPNALEQFLREGDQVEKLNDAVKAIEESDYETREDYGAIEFLNVPYRYRLTEKVTNLYEE